MREKQELHKIPVCFDEALSAIVFPLKKVHKTDLKTARGIVTRFLQDLDFIMKEAEDYNDAQTCYPVRY